MKEQYLQTPLKDEDIKKLRSGDLVFLSGFIYSARDAAHKKMIDLLDAGKSLPFDPFGAVIYYLGPTPAPQGRCIGSAGPTTSYRMDVYTPRLHSIGVKASIGKGKRNEEVRESLENYTAVYFGATGGAGALLSSCIRESTIIAFEDLGPEAIRRLKVENFPLLVINDCYGGEFYAEAKLPKDL